MQNTLAFHSVNWVQKSKFFINRALIYSFFLLFPVWSQKTLDLPLWGQVFIMAMYIFFMAGQWFLLGKEIDYRLRIYFRVNSSVDRLLYRFILGMMVMLIYFNFLSFFSHKWIYNLFWGTWAVLGLFYSWPTRGKIIRESMATSLGEFRFLDSFEKTLVFLIVLVFIVSFPQLSPLNSREALQLYFDPSEHLSLQIWNFFTINYYPFYQYPELIKIAWSMHFYFIGFGLFLISFYALARYFFSRRLSLLGVFALVSSWSVSKILEANFGDTLFATYSIIWVWAMLWVMKSGTYRSGLFLGLVNYYGVLINQTLIFLFVLQFLGYYFLFSSDRSYWYKRQVLRYTILGFFLSLGVTIVNIEKFEYLNPLTLGHIAHFIELFNRKSIYVISLIGLIIFCWKLLSIYKKPMNTLVAEKHKFLYLLFSISILFFYSLAFEARLITSFAFLGFLAFFSVFPLEYIFQKLTRLRSKRNMIFVAYILICLLDSHFEGRVKIFLALFS